MTQQVKTVKRLLNAIFPGYGFSVYMKRARNYVDSSDRIIVVTHKAVTDEVIKQLKQVTKGIVIGRYGKALCKFDKTPPAMYDVEEKKWLDFDLCEFIEVANQYDVG